MDAITWVQAAWPITNVEQVQAALAAGQWSQFAEAPCYDPPDEEPCLAIANPGPGRWALSPAIWFGGGLVALLAEPEERMVYRVVSTQWKGYDQYADGKSNYEAGDWGYGSGHRLFAEHNGPDFVGPADGRELHSKVYVEVEITPAAVAGREPTAYLRAFDPDHYSQDAAGFDPNDLLDALLQIVVVPEDNRAAGGAPVGADGGATLPASAAFQANQFVQRVVLEVDARQPGNNFIVAVSGRSESVDAAEFAPDGVTLRRGSDHQPALESHVTPILTIWRSLHIEFDSMGAPTDAQGLGPNSWHPDDAYQGEPQGDQPPGNIANLNGELPAIHDLFLPALVVARDDLTAADVRDDSLFVHNFGTDADAIANGDSVRDVRSEVDYWVVQVFAAYEFTQQRDHDPLHSAFLGGRALGLGHDKPTVIYTETMRDVSATNVQECGALPPPGHLTRAVVHEVAHRFDMEHAIPPDPLNPGDQGPLNLNFTTCGNDVAPFTLAQLGVVRKVPKPD